MRGEEDFATLAFEAVVGDWIGLIAAKVELAAVYV